VSVAEVSSRAPQRTSADFGHWPQPGIEPDRLGRPISITRRHHRRNHRWRREEVKPSLSGARCAIRVGAGRH
jgi:hypothetical protein